MATLDSLILSPTLDQSPTGSSSTLLAASAWARSFLLVLSVLVRMVVGLSSSMASRKAEHWVSRGYLVRREQVEEYLHQLGVVSVEVAEELFELHYVLGARLAFFAQLFEVGQHFEVRVDLHAKQLRVGLRESLVHSYAVHVSVMPGYRPVPLLPRGALRR